jgi:glycerol kinase
MVCWNSKLAMLAFVLNRDSSTVRLRDQVGLIDESAEMDALCSHVKDTGGVYFVTAFSGLLAP